MTTEAQQLLNAAFAGTLNLDADAAQSAGPTAADSQAGKPADNATPAPAAGAIAAQDDEQPAPIASKSGEYTIPYEKLTDARSERDRYKAEVASGRPLAAALAAKPIDESVIAVAFSRVRLRLTPGARGVLGILSVLTFFVAGTVLMAAIMVAVLPLLGPIALAGIVGIALLGPLVVAVLALGLGWVITERVVPGILNNIANEELRKSLDIERERIRRQLNDQDIFTYAGEGLAEAIASKVITQARTQGVDIPGNTLSGRERMVPQLFECIVVTEGEISVLLGE